MEKYIMAVLTLMPGFLAINTAEKLGKTHTKKTGVSLALAYASYTIVSVLVTMSASLIWLPGGVSMRQAAGGEMPPSFYAALVAVSVATSIISGAAWSLFLSDWILRKCNAINTSRGKNIRWEDGSLFHHLIKDW